MNVWYINSILGAICLEEENDALCGVHFCPDGAPELEPLPRRVVETPLLQEAEEQLNEYFAGVRREFDLPLAAKGWNVFDTLQNNDAYHALQAVDGLIITGATGTNVNDVTVVLIGGEAQADA